MHVSNKVKYTSYGIGFLIGCLLVWKLVIQRNHLSLEAKSESQLKPWYGFVYFESKEKLHESAGDILFYRIRIIGEGKVERVVRLEEWGSQNVNSQRERINKRQVTSVTQFYLKLIKGKTKEDLINLFNERNILFDKIEDLGKELYRVTIPEERNQDKVTEIIDELIAEKNAVVHGWPYYTKSHF